MESNDALFKGTTSSNFIAFYRNRGFPGDPVRNAG
jgi:hypothetical protein